MMMGIPEGDSVLDAPEISINRKNSHLSSEHVCGIFVSWLRPQSFVLALIQKRKSPQRQFSINWGFP